MSVRILTYKFSLQICQLFKKIQQFVPKLIKKISNMKEIGKLQNIRDHRFAK